MNKSQKIYFSSGTTTNDNSIKVRLEQDVDTLEFLSMKIDTKEVYQDFNADYGVLVGRVTANGGVGVENAKISVFLPLSDEDAQDPRIYRIYPYKSPRDKNTEGKRYNLLPRVSRRNPVTDELEPKQAFGSFPIREEIVTNEPFLNVYRKYYKYTATTNEAGDYMIFGVPIGTQTVHMSVDITDIGEYSMNPAAMVVNLNYPESSFTDNNTRIKPQDDLTDLPHIETQEVSVDVVPFWGDTENFEIGITRQDFRIRAVLTNTFVLFGSSFTDDSYAMRGSVNDGGGSSDREIRDYFTTFPNEETDTGSGEFQNALANKRISEITEKIYYYPVDISDDDIDNGIADPIEDMQILNENEYSVYKRDGDFAFIINCNRRRVITNDDGDEVEVDANSSEGVFTEFRGFITLEYTFESAPMNAESYLDPNSAAARETTRTLPLRMRLKFPQHADKNGNFVWDQTSTNNINWRKEHMKFEAQKFYSISTFIPAIKNDGSSDGGQWSKVDSFFAKDQMNFAEGNMRQTIGPIRVKDRAGYNNSDYEMVGNAEDSAGKDQRFAANWLNLCVYFPQLGYTVNEDRGTSLDEVRVADYLAEQYKKDNDKNIYFIFDNPMPIAGGNVNTKWFGRNDIHWTDIIEVPLADIKAMKGYAKKGFTDSQVSVTTSNYRNGSTKPSSTPWKGTWTTECPFNGGKIDGIASNSKDPLFYFYKGFDAADCIDYLYVLGLVT
jgi:hypothetical protein